MSKPNIKTISHSHGKTEKKERKKEKEKKKIFVTFRSIALVGSKTPNKRQRKIAF